MFVRFERRLRVPELDAERTLSMVRRPGLRIYTISTRGLTVDSCAAPGLSPVRPASARPAGQLTVALDGEFVVRRSGRQLSAHGRRAICDAVDVYDERWDGRSFRALVFEWDAAHGAAVEGAQDLVLGGRDLAGLVEIADALDAGRLCTRATARAFARIAAAGVPVRGLAATDAPAPPAAQRLATVVGRMLGQLHAAPNIDDLAAACGMEERQLRRSLRACAPWFLPGAATWKTALHQTRLTMATCLPSARAFTTERMATALGYRHPAALLRALRQGRLPTPHEMRGRLGRA